MMLKTGKGGITVFCGRCGKELPENARFCGACGAPIAHVPTPSPAINEPPVEQAEPIVPDEETLFEEERALIVRCDQEIRREHTMWKAVGIVLLVCSVCLFVAAVFAAFVPTRYNTVACAGFGVMALVAAVVNLCMAYKTKMLYALIYTDIRPIAERYSGSALIVWSAVFNLIAMTMVIGTVNLLKVKTAVVTRIVQRQQLSQDI